MSLKKLFDPGHGGIAFGHYLTPGKRSPEVPPGIFEGEYNRIICDLMAEHDPDCLNIAPGPINVPLKARVSFVNRLSHLERCVLLSIHCNAAGSSGWDSANGFTVFVSHHASQDSKRLAAHVAERLEHHLYGFIAPRKPVIKQVNHTITTATRCPAVLIELGFMTNKREVNNLQRPMVQNLIRAALQESIDRYQHATV